MQRERGLENMAEGNSYHGEGVDRERSLFDMEKTICTLRRWEEAKDGRLI